MEHTYQIRDILLKSCIEFTILPGKAVQELIALIDSSDELHDSDYNCSKGISLVMTNNNTLIGTGAVRCFDDQTCELKRVFFKPEYRNKGLDKKMIEELIKYARKHALHVYKKLGFYQIPAYKNSQAQVSMQKDIETL